MSDPNLQSALKTASSLKAGSWESVEALALLAIAAEGDPEAMRLLETARTTADRLKPGAWQSVRALSYLSIAERRCR